MSKVNAVRRKKDVKSKSASESISSPKSSLSDITKYTVKLPPSIGSDSSDTYVSVPCPDDAALPCSAYLNSFSNKMANNGVHPEIRNCKSCKNLHVMSSGNIKNSPLAASIRASNMGSKKKTKKSTLISSNSQITDYFPVRRSNRKTSVLKMTERNKVIEEAILSGREEGFEIKEFSDKGRGIITTKAIKRGEFVLEYHGELIDYDEAKRREGIYSDKENIGCYMYYFRLKNRQYCIDATKETERLGRLVNHSKKGNLRTRTFLIQESPHLILFAGRDIQPGEELSYDYGDRRKAALESHPWLAC